MSTLGPERRLKEELQAEVGHRMQGERRTAEALERIVGDDDEEEEDEQSP